MARRPEMVVRHHDLLKRFMINRFDATGLAVQIGKSKQFTSELVRGDRRSCARDTAQRIADALGVRLHELFEPPPPDIRAEIRAAVLTAIDAAGASSYVDDGMDE